MFTVFMETESTSKYFMAAINVVYISIFLSQDLALACNLYRWASILYSVERAYLNQPPSPVLDRIF